MNKTKLIKIFKSCLDTLRDHEALTGEKALRNMSYFLILKLLESKFDNEIDIDNYEYDFSHIENNVSKYKNDMLSIARFSNIVKENEMDIPLKMKYLWEDILSMHPVTKNIFHQNMNFDIKGQYTFKKLIDKINMIESSIDFDILGEAYEGVIKEVMTGKVFGQFITPPQVKNLMIEIINPQIHSDGKIDTCFDPAMGTGGLLITYLKHILKQR